MDFSSNVANTWRKRFFETGEFLSNLYTELVNKYGGKAIQDLLVYASLAEKVQAYVWTYIDYGIRTPIYRTLQWLGFAFPNGINWKDIISSGRSRREGVIVRNFINELTAHMLKEYLLIWSMIMNVLYEELEDKKLSERIKSTLGLDIQESEIKDVKGLASELQASYVLIDHGKSFLPFSIMQSPITPSYVRPGSASGDFYLFEENLVVDVKTGWLDSRTGLPTYCYGKGCKEVSLSKDLKNISDMHRLYGIRKGIGVVAEDEDYIYLAIYVPWRYWRVQGPLLQLKSLKLPFAIYMNNVVCNDELRGVKLHEAIIRNNGLHLTIAAYDFSEKPSKREISSENIELEFLGNPETRLKGTVSRDKANPRRFIIEFSIEASKVEESIIKHGKSGRRIVLAKLIVRREGVETPLTYPVIAITT